VLRLSLLPLTATAFLLGAPIAHACGPTGYSYAGVTSQARVHGVSATVTSLAAPAVQNGHVAGWVGVGGPGLGPHGSSEWIQVGYSGFPGLSVGSLYYEVALPGAAPTYHEVLSTVRPGARHRVAVLELSRHPNWWRVWVDGRRAGKAYRLPGSHGAWRGVATAESWGGGMRACNEYSYRFQRVSVARHEGGSWQRLDSVYRMHQGDNRLLLASPSSFVARTARLARPAPSPAAARRTHPAAARTAAAAQPPVPATPPVVTVPVDAAPADPTTTVPADAPPVEPTGTDEDAVGETPSIGPGRSP
jgi:hypothetical protein